MRKAGDIIQEMFREQFGSGFMEIANSTAGVFSSWKGIITEVFSNNGEHGEENLPAAAVHSSVCNLERGLLLVEADHPGWIQLLETRNRELLSVIQRRYPELGIKGIAFRLCKEPIASGGNIVH